jgi:hypothetical protein
MIPFLVSVIWLGIGIRQWFVLSKYRELQKSIDKKLEDANDNRAKD